MVEQNKDTQDILDQVKDTINDGVEAVAGKKPEELLEDAKKEVDRIVEEEKKQKEEKDRKDKEEQERQEERKEDEKKRNIGLMMRMKFLYERAKRRLAELTKPACDFLGTTNGKDNSNYYKMAGAAVAAYAMYNGYGVLGAAAAYLAVTKIGPILAEKLEQGVKYIQEQLGKGNKPAELEKGKDGKSLTKENVKELGHTSVKEKQPLTKEMGQQKAVSVLKEKAPQAKLSELEAARLRLERAYAAVGKGKTPTVEQDKEIQAAGKHYTAVMDKETKNMKDRNESHWAAKGAAMAVNVGLAPVGTSVNVHDNGDLHVDIAKLPGQKEGVLTMKVGNVDRPLDVVKQVGNLEKNTALNQDQAIRIGEGYRNIIGNTNTMDKIDKLERESKAVTKSAEIGAVKKDNFVYQDKSQAKINVNTIPKEPKKKEVTKSMEGPSQGLSRKV